LSKQSVSTQNLENQDLIALLDVYLNEFIHRDNLLWSQVFKFFYASIIVMLLPNISDFLSINLPPFPVLLFRVLGLIMSVVFLYLALGYGKRLEASTSTYKMLIEKLKPNYQRIKLRNLKFGRFFEIRTSYVVILFMFLSIIVIDIIFIIYGI